MEQYNLKITNFLTFNLDLNYTPAQLADIEKMVAKLIEVTKDKQIVVK